MWKNVALLVISFHLAMTLRAQENQNGYKKFGFMAGASFSHIDFAKGIPPPVVPIQTSWRTAITLGLLMKLHLKSNFYLQPEYSFSQMGGKIKDSAIAYKLN